MRKLLLLFMLLLSLPCFAQIKFSELPLLADTTFNDSTRAIVIKKQADGTYKNYLLKVSQSILTPIIDTVYIIISGFAANKMNALTMIPGENTHVFSADINTFARFSDTTASFNDSLPNNPEDKCLVGGAIVRHTSGHFVNFVCRGSDVFNVVGGATNYQVNYLGQGAIFQYNKSIHAWVTIADIAGDSQYVKSNMITPPATGGTGIANNNASTMTISGAFPVTYTVTAATAITLPTVGTVAATTNSITLTNKRITARYGSTTSSGTPTINTDNVDTYELTAEAANITSFTTNLSGTPTTDQILHIAVTATGSFTVTFGSAFEASSISLPISINTQRQDWYFIFTAAGKWRIGGVW